MRGRATVDPWGTVDKAVVVVCDSSLLAAFEWCSRVDHAALTHTPMRCGLTFAAFSKEVRIQSTFAFTILPA